MEFGEGSGTAEISELQVAHPSRRHSLGGAVGPIRHQRRGRSSMGGASPQEGGRVLRVGAPEAESGPMAEVAEPPYPWASRLPCKVKSMAELRQEQISRIWGDIRCKRCSLQNRVELSLSETYTEVRDALAQTDWKGRAPQILLRPKLLDCPSCGRENMAQPNRYENKVFNNWLFMALSQTLGICNIQELRFFCQKNGLHSSGAKGVLLHTAYETILQQLEGAVQPH